MRICLISLISVMALAGCGSDRDVTTIHLEYNSTTGIASGWVRDQGKLTKIHMEPEQLELISKKNN